MNNTMRVLVIALAVAGLAACGKKTVKDDVRSTTPSDPRPTQVQTNNTDASDGFSVADPNDPNAAPCLKVRVVNFDFDQSSVRPEFQATIDCHAKYLGLNGQWALSLEGHADERGSREYNMGLGERRGNSVSDLFKAKGTDSSQLMVTSFGEERPTCTESSEDCWSNNRRVELVYTKK